LVNMCICITHKPRKGSLQCQNTCRSAALLHHGVFVTPVLNDRICTHDLLIHYIIMGLLPKKYRTKFSADTHMTDVTANFNCNFLKHVVKFINQKEYKGMVGAVYRLFAVPAVVGVEYRMRRRF